ncbi:GNAT family N-acetyltransferase [Tautonia sociabilis]|uniref:GNAT family N-acetyltransferase n=1 Tax=Tautonia sociabilis TaxID=2080755 RepID=A0A432MKF8_9BACT|nr:GNAT family N-acetyltransferase [Tautonia sociabilis]RUL87891.1 GNAT family N-acetyltransferase [Tautonia sociabilis]
MTTLRTARNDDVPALADLWNRGTPSYGVARPLSAREFGDAALGRLDYDPLGLLIAERDGRPVGFAHSGFGPVSPAGPSHRLDRSMGTVAMLVIEPEAGPEVGVALVDRARRDLRDRGAQVVYAGGRAPLNPFYWGLYGGSEFSGVLGAHESFHRAVRDRGFRPSARSVLLELDLLGLSDPPFDPRTLLLRRRYRVEVEPDASFERWWDALALGSTFATSFRVSDPLGHRVARATTWDMDGFERQDGRLRAGLIDVVVDPSRRRQGLGRYLIREVIRHHASRGIHALAVQTDEQNEPALALYRSLGFEPVEEAILYRSDPF